VCVSRTQVPPQDIAPFTSTESSMVSRICPGLCILLLFALMGSFALAAPASKEVEKPTATTSEEQAQGPAGETADTAKAEQPAKSDEAADAEKPSTKEPAEPAKEEPAPKEGEKKPVDKPNGTKPETHKVIREPFVVKVSLDGVFEARRMHELLLSPETWSTYKVVSAVEHGGRVDKGQVVVRFETEDIDRAIADLKRDLALDALTLTVTELELRTLEELVPMNVAMVKRQQKYNEEDHRHYMETEAPLARRTADIILEQARQTLEYQQEELEQLEKMYKEDDLTEETEEIVLQRARNAVERAQFLFERTKILHERTVKVELPRQKIAAEEEAERNILTSELLHATLPLQLEQTRVAVEKAKVAKKRSEERLADLEADHKLMAIKAPAEGIVYYGRCVDGKWRRGSSAESLQRQGSITANDVFMTIVEPRPMVIRTTVAQKHLADVRPGLKGIATSDAVPTLKLPVRLDRIARVPNDGSEFDAVFRVSLDLEADPLMPGMTCKMEFVPYRQRRALAVPSKAVFTDDWDLKKQYVWLYRDGAKPRRQTVVIGRKTDEKTEILEGLEAGDEILLKAPEDKP